MSNLYLLLGLYEHDKQELARRRYIIYHKNRFIEEYHTIIIGDIYIHNGGGLTGIISTHLSDTISHTKTLGNTNFPIEQKLPLCFGVMQAIKNYTQIQLIHSFGEDCQLQLISVRKKGINFSLEGEYKGSCYNIAEQHKDMINFYNYDPTNTPLDEIINIVSKGLYNKRHAQFELRLNNNTDNKGGGSNSDNSPEPTPADRVPKFYPEMV